MLFKQQYDHTDLSSTDFDADDKHHIVDIDNQSIDYLLGWAQYILEKQCSSCQPI